MLSFILLILLALGFGYFATQNTEGITLHFANYTLYGTPLYIVLGGVLLVGLLFSWIISLINGIFISIKLHGKESAIKDSKRTIHELTKKVNQLEVENAKLQGRIEKDAYVEDSL